MFRERAHSRPFACCEKYDLHESVGSAYAPPVLYYLSAKCQWRDRTARSGIAVPSRAVDEKLHARPRVELNGSITNPVSVRRFDDTNVPRDPQVVSRWAVIEWSHSPSHSSV